MALGKHYATVQPKDLGGPMSSPLTMMSQQQERGRQQSTHPMFFQGRGNCIDGAACRINSSPGGCGPTLLGGLYPPPALAAMVAEAAAQSGTKSVAAAAAQAHAVAHAAATAAAQNTRPVVGRVWCLSQSPEGCRQVQQALEDAPSDEARAALASELQGHIWEALRCPHANHVVQKCIMTMRPQASQFIIDELMNGGRHVTQAARHKYGCRIIQRLLEHCRPDQVQQVVEALLGDAVPLCKHTYANYVMQHVLEQGDASTRHRLSEFLSTHARAVGSDSCGCAVMGKALMLGAGDDQTMLARALLREQGLLAAMARSRYGHTAVKAVLNLLEDAERSDAQCQLRNASGALCASRYGRSVLASLDRS